MAQKTLSEGTINYDISIQSSKGAAGSNLSGTQLSIYVKPTISMTEMTSSLGTETTVYDNKAGKGFILKQYSGQKLMITTTRENWLQKNQWNNTVEFRIDDAPVTINGYSCRKATGITQDGKTFEVYFTPDIVVANNQYNNSFDHLPGLAVQYEIKSGDFTFKYSLNKVSYDPVPATKFEVPKAGYRVMTYEESQALKKGN